MAVSRPVFGPVPDNCLAGEVLNRIGDKWSVYAIASLGGGTLRFSELRREIDGISQRMLTVTLRALERDGLEPVKSSVVSYRRPVRCRTPVSGNPYP
jgi:DNA-binding HxlR family transcriptional regulator